METSWTLFNNSPISRNGCIDDVTQRRTAKASASFGRLRQRLWNNHHESMRVKDKIYRAIVLSTLLYGAEVWTVYRRQVKNLHAFMLRHLRSILRIIWMDKLTNKEILERTELPPMEDLLIRKNLRGTGHRVFPNHYLPFLSSKFNLVLSSHWLFSPSHSYRWLGRYDTRTMI